MNIKEWKSHLSDIIDIYVSNEGIGLGYVLYKNAEKKMAIYRKILKDLSLLINNTEINKIFISIISIEINDENIESMLDIDTLYKNKKPNNIAFLNLILKSEDNYLINILKHVKNQ